VDHVVDVIDSDQHLFETRTLWADHIDPGHRDEALAIVDDDLGYSWLTWRGQHLSLAQVQHPGATTELGDLTQRSRNRLPSESSYDDELPANYWEPAARLEQLASMGLDGAVLFPNFGLLWERSLSTSLVALTSNMTAWNRWCATVVAEGAGRLHPVAHLTLRDPEWLEAQLATLSAHGVRLAMIAPAAVDGRPLSHPSHDRLWAAFVHHGVTPVFHVADQPRIVDEAFYPKQDHTTISALDSIFLWVPPAIAITDLIVNGAFERHPGLRVGIVELSSIWVPLYLRMLDGGWEFTSALNGETPSELTQRPSEYFRNQVRVSAFSYEQPSRLMSASGDVFMCCSDYPHSEGTASPLADYAGSGGPPSDAHGFYHDNIGVLLGD
jgi:predicted TIM-barrel fold metal-dependent hydrolase